MHVCEDVVMKQIILHVKLKVNKNKMFYTREERNVPPFLHCYKSDPKTSRQAKQTRPRAAAHAPLPQREGAQHKCFSLSLTEN